MSQSFSTADSRHNFSIDEKPYFLPGISVDDFDKLATVLKTPEAERFDATKDFVLSYADARTQKALRTLTIAQFTQLFRGWIGLANGADVTPGESSSSVE